MPGQARVFANIADGTHDNRLDRIAAAVRTRQTHLANELFRTVQQGDTVRIIDVNIRPARLQGVTGIVVGKLRSRILISLADGTRLRCNPIMLRAVNAVPVAVPAPVRVPLVGRLSA